MDEQWKTHFCVCCQSLCCFKSILDNHKCDKILKLSFFPSLYSKFYSVFVWVFVWSGHHFIKSCCVFIRTSYTIQSHSAVLAAEKLQQNVYVLLWLFIYLIFQTVTKSHTILLLSGLLMLLFFVTSLKRFSLNDDWAKCNKSLCWTVNEKRDFPNVIKT